MWFRKSTAPPFHRSITLRLEQLEDRLVPSASTASVLPLPTVDSSAHHPAALVATPDHTSTHETGQSQVQQQAAPGTDLRPPSVTFDFSQFQPQTTGYTYTVRVRYNGGNWTPAGPIEILPNTGPQAVATLLYNTIPVAKEIKPGEWLPGFDSVTLNAAGTAVTVSGFWRNAQGAGSDITGRNSSVKGYDTTIGGGFSPGSAPNAPTPSNLSQSSSPQTSGSQVAFNLAPSEIDGTASLQENATLTATIDGVMVQLNELAGETYSQVAMDLYVALVNQGLTGVSTDGNGDVILSNDFSGQPVSTLGIQLATPTGDLVDWIDTGEGQYPS